MRLCPVLPLVWRLLGHPASPSEPALVFCRNPVFCGVAEGLCEPKTSAKLLLSAGRSWSQWGRSQSLGMYHSLLCHYSFELDSNYFSHFNFFSCLIKLMREHLPSLSLIAYFERIPGGFSYWLNAHGNFNWSCLITWLSWWGTRPKQEGPYQQEERSQHLPAQHEWWYRLLLPSSRCDCCITVV